MLYRELSFVTAVVPDTSSIRLSQPAVGVYAKFQFVTNHHKVIKDHRLGYTLAVPITILHNHRLSTPLLSMQKQHKCLLTIGTSNRFSITVLLTA